MTERLDAKHSRHFTLNVQMTGRGMKEATHRTRSFLFAVLGAIAAEAFGLDRVSFHENGVVSLNLPLLGNIIGSRATRTTHPKTLTHFTNFLGQVFEGGMRIDNPSFWKTKTEIVETINRLRMAHQIRRTHSCADVHNRTKQYFHCGRCSQCIDRRFAMLAAGLEGEDPAEAYRVDLMTGARERIADRELALAYVRSADMCRVLTPELLATNYPAVWDAVRCLGEPEETALDRITDLLRRHGESVMGVMDAVLQHKSSDAFPVDSLPRLYGDNKRTQMFGSGIRAQPIADEPSRRMIMEIDEENRRATFDGVVEIRGEATFGLLHELAKENLRGAGLGLDLFEYPAVRADRLAKLLGLESDEGVRQRVTRARTELAKRFASAGLDPNAGGEVIETVSGDGYRLAPDRVRVQKKRG
jgi:7-cyano-7-deazaguanine synthase in queuosine biosynthesis